MENKNEMVNETETKNEMITRIYENELLDAMYSNGMQISYSSFVPETFEDKKFFVNILNNPQNRLKDHINEQICLKHVIVVPREVNDSKTGEIRSYKVILLIDTNKSVYATSSFGVMKSLENIIRVFGLPPYDGINVKITQTSKGTDKNYLNLVVV